MLIFQGTKDFHALDPAISDLALAGQLKGRIEQRASGRIHDLSVECSTDLIILRGRSRTYHAKQLAQQAVLDHVAGHTHVANQIVVS